MSFDFETLITGVIVIATLIGAWHAWSVVMSGDEDSDGQVINRIAAKRGFIYKVLLVAANVLEAVFMASIAQDHEYSFLIRFAMHLIIAAFGSVAGFAVLRELTQAVLQTIDFFKKVASKERGQIGAFILMIKEIIEGLLSLFAALAAPYSNFFIGYMFKTGKTWEDFKPIVYYDWTQINELPEVLFGSFVVIQFHLFGIILLSIVSVDSMVKAYQQKEEEAPINLNFGEVINFFFTHAKKFGVNYNSKQDVWDWVNNGDKFNNQLILEDFFLKARDFNNIRKDNTASRNKRIAANKQYEAIMQQAYKVMNP